MTEADEMMRKAEEWLKKEHAAIAAKYHPNSKECLECNGRPNSYEVKKLADFGKQVEQETARQIADECDMFHKIHSPETGRFPDCGSAIRSKYGVKS